MRRLATCDERLIDLFSVIVEDVDCTILEGHRDQVTQDAYFHEGKSQLQWPNSKHNSQPSMAVDVAPYPIDWQNTERFIAFAFYVLGRAKERGIKLRLGADWDGDFNPNNNWFDGVHFELVD